MSFITRFPPVALRSRPWLTREKGECAFPVGGEGTGLQACCNPCGSAPYCRPHAAAMRGPRKRPIAELEWEIMRLPEFRERRR